MLVSSIKPLDYISTQWDKFIVIDASCNFVTALNTETKEVEYLDGDNGIITGEYGDISHIIQTNNGNIYQYLEKLPIKSNEFIKETLELVKKVEAEIYWNKL